MLIGLDEFYEYKNQFMNDILTNDEILRLMDDDYIQRAKPEDLMYTQVFPFEYVPEPIEHAHTFICCDIDVQRATNKTFLQPIIYVWVFAHKSKLRLPDGAGVRTDKLASEIVKTINGSRQYGLGELDFYSSKRFAPINDYQGKMLVFHATEFNRQLPTGKPIPANRRHPV